MPAATSSRSAELLRPERGDCGPGPGTAQYRRADPVPGVPGADLERTRGLREGPGATEGGTPPRHAGRSDRTNRCPRLPWPVIPCPKGAGDAIRVLEPGLASVVPQATGAGCRVIGRAWVMPMRCRGALAEGRALAGRAIQRKYRTGPLQNHPPGRWLSEVCRLMGRGEEAWQHAHQALDLALQQKEVWDEGDTRSTSLGRPGPRRPPDAAPAEATTS